MAKRNAFITLKDHKPNFNNAPTCRLINPTKSEIECISKEILQTIVKSVAASTIVNLWRSTQSGLEWFNKTLPFYEARKRTILRTREEQPPTKHHQTNPREYKSKAVEHLV